MNHCTMRDRENESKIAPWEEGEGLAEVRNWWAERAWQRVGARFINNQSLDHLLHANISKWAMRGGQRVT